MCRRVCFADKGMVQSGTWQRSAFCLSSTYPPKHMCLCSAQSVHASDDHLCLTAVPTPTPSRVTPLSQNEPEMIEGLLAELATYRQPRLGAAGTYALK